MLTEEQKLATLSMKLAFAQHQLSYDIYSSHKSLKQKLLLSNRQREAIWLLGRFY